MLMRAMSLGIIKGKIDEVSKMVTITWVQPRVLDKEQIQLLSDQLESWAERFLILSFVFFSFVFSRINNITCLYVMGVFASIHYIF